MGNMIRPTAAALVAGIMASERAGAAPAATIEPLDGPNHVRLALESPALGERRAARIALSAGYERSDVDYPVVVILDGEHSFEFLAPLISFLGRTGAMPMAIVVAVENTSRERDYTPPGMRIAGVDAGGDAFLEFLGGELLPAVDSAFRTSDLRVIVGHSHGGLLAAYALVKTPRLVDAAVALDCPFLLDDRWLPRRLLDRCDAAPESPIRLIVGQTRFEYDDDLWERLRGRAGAIHRQAAPHRG